MEDRAFMSGPITDELRAARSRAGKLGAARKWGGQRIVRLDELDPDTARLIRALLAQRQAEPPTPEAA